MSSEIRRTENEYILQAINASVAERVIDIAPGDSGMGMVLNFRCECSELNCHQYISLQIEDYQRIVKHAGQFIVYQSHEQLDIETVVGSEPDYTVVEKRTDLVEKVA